jgi:hypothetical protein
MNRLPQIQMLGTPSFGDVCVQIAPAAGGRLIQ